MAAIQRYETAAGVRYRVRYWDDAHRQKSRTFRLKREADIFKRQVETQLAEGEYIDPELKTIPVSALYPTYIASKKGVVKKTYLRDLESAWRVHVKPQWGSRALGSIRRSEIQAWVSGLSAGDEKKDIPAKSPSVVIRAYDLLKQLLDLAVADGLIRKTPCENISLPKKIIKRRVYLSAEQLLALANASGRYSTLVLVLGFCGLRMGEARGLTVDDIDFSESRIAVERSVTRVNRTWEESDPKTRVKRSVPVPGYVMKRLEEECKGKRGDALVFTNARGGYLGEYRRTAYGWYSRALQASGVPPLTIHDLRHTAASIAISSGANPEAVQRMLGHKRASETLDRYAGLFDRDLDSVAVRMDAQISDAMSHTCHNAEKTA